ncbi:MAG: response regulator [Rhodospirillales bacterium]|nr:MAG: response regulator [Rhodospirillales bacterium]
MLQSGQAEAPYLAQPLLESAGPCGCDVLLVVADAWCQEVASGLRSLGGHRVSVAGSGGEAADLCARQPFQVIVLDDALPSSSALDTVWRIVRLPDVVGPISIILLVETLPPLELCQAYARAGVLMMVAKPVTANLLQSAFRLLSREILAWGR